MNVKQVISSSGCPFAENAKTTEAGGNSKSLERIIMNWDDAFDVVIFKPSFYWTTYYNYCIHNELTFSSFNLIAIPNEKVGYILIQKLDELIEASEKLEAEGYYKNYTEKQWEHIKRRRGLIG